LGAIDGAKQSSLQGEIEISDFIDEQGAIICVFEEARMGAQCACKCSSFVAEQGRFNEVRRYSCAVKDNKRFRGARTCFVNSLGEDLLTRACFAFENDGDVCSRQTLQQGVKASHFHTSAEQRAEVGLRGQWHNGGFARLHTKNGAPHTNVFAALQNGIEGDDAIDQSAVGRAEVGQAKAAGFELQAGVTARDLKVGQADIAGWSLAEESSCSLISDIYEK
jgi:hypothetical protein